ncbi:2-(hydroxymethyl)glutarate dehydrogenase-like [Macrobrachium nipponense]|uniref:2-(hydroxymethyl)glutarate dehydrogenase-like n=1 Tax=Macrobrachium nipponense TaxID=159736 RepID=UPI0030C8365F
MLRTVTGGLTRVFRSLRLGPISSEFQPQVRNLATATKDTRVGVIGCGQVGNAICHNLTRKGYNVVAACDTDASKLDAIPSSIKRLVTPADVVKASEVIFTCLPKPPNVRTVAEGPDGILGSLSKGQVWIDHSTTEFEQTEIYMEEVKKLGGHMLESPITGGLEALQKGQMIALVGGDKAVVDAVQPLFDASYSKTFYVGDTVGAAMVIKVMSNSLCCVHVIAMGEALMMGKRANIDLRTFWEGIRLSVGNSYVWETAAPVIFNGGSYDPGFSLSLQNKDLQLGYDMARKFKVPMEMHHMALGVYRRAEYQYGEEAGCYIPPKGMEDALNESLQIPGFEKWGYNIVIEEGSLNIRHEGIHQNK